MGRWTRQMNKKANKFIKTYVELFEVTRNPFDAILYSFILNQGEIQKTNEPKIEQTHLQETFNVGRRVITRSLTELQEDGLIEFTKDYNCKGKKKYITTKFTLKYQLQEEQTDTPNAEPIQNAETQDATEQTTFEEPTISREESQNEIGMRMLDEIGYTPIKTYSDFLGEASTQSTTYYEDLENLNTPEKETPVLSDSHNITYNDDDFFNDGIPTKEEVEQKRKNEINPKFR